MELWLFSALLFVCGIYAQAFDVDIFMEKFGYLEPLKNNFSRHPSDRQKALLTYQENFELRPTGFLSLETIHHMKQPRCGLPDFDDTPASFRASGRKWKKNTLQYSFLNGSSDLDMEEVKKAIAQGFKYWTDVTPLKALLTNRSESDLKILFGKGKHGDGQKNAFDGPGGVLAHAFYPQNGRIHFDEDEKWTARSYKGINLEIVAAHEIGHALGLGHTFVKGALMYPTYQGYSPKFKLHKDDIDGITYLYGKQQVVKEEVQLADNVCELAAFKAVAQGPDELSLIFNGKYVYTVDRAGSEKKQLLTDVFEKPPRDVVAATYAANINRYLLVKGRKVYHYRTNFTLDRTSLLPKKLPFNPDALLHWKSGRSAFLVLFRGTKMFTYDLLSGRVSGPHTSAKYFPKSPASMHSATVWSDGFIYFFKSRQFWKVHPNSRRVVSGFPKKVKENFVLCGGQLNVTPRPKVFKVRPFPTPRRKRLDRRQSRSTFD